VQVATFKNGAIAPVILLCTAMNEIDYTALETLEAINLQLKQQGITLTLSEIKGPVMVSARHIRFPDSP